jgi:hypothetical protein
MRRLDRVISLRAIFAFATFLLIMPAAPVSGQSRDANDRSYGAEMNRDRAESRLERLRRNKQQKKDAATARSKRRLNVPPEDNGRKSAR